MSQTFLDPELTRHWRYYLILESELETALRYVEPHPDNARSFSLEFARQLLATCAQFETVAKLYCVQRTPGPPPSGIRGIHDHLARHWRGLSNWQTRFYPQNELIAPFATWTPKSPPPWWTAYNKVKHEPVANLRHANLENAIASVAAVGLITLSYLGNNAQPGSSRLFDLFPH